MAFTRHRNDFPILERKIHGKSLVYLDNAATTQKPQQVIRAVTTYYERTNANIHRGIHTLAEEATAQYEAARATVARFLGASDPHEIVFVRNATEGINLVARTLAARRLAEGARTIVTTEMEHHSNLVPWMLLNTQVSCSDVSSPRKRGSSAVVENVDSRIRGNDELRRMLRYIPMTPLGELDLSTIDDLITKEIAIVSVTHASNVLGTINDVRAIARVAHAHDIPVLVDAAQSAPHIPINVQELGCDALVFSGHKLYGPTGIGVLWMRRALLEALDPFLGGGDMIRSVSYDGFTPNDVPWKFEAGTPNIAGTIGLAAAITYIERIGFDRIIAHERELTRACLEQLATIPGMRMYGLGAKRERLGVISFTIDGVHPHDLATLLDREGIAIRAGHHCAEPLVKKFGVAAMARVSVGLYNTKKDIDALVRAIEKARRVFTV